MKQLIICADDFGLTKSVNEGIARAYSDGIVTSVNLIPTGEAFDDAIDRARSLGLKEAGGHLSLTETKALTGRSQIPTLVISDGRFSKGHVLFFLKLVCGIIDLDQAYIELKNQMERLASSGLRITNLSGHEHIHMLPQILDIFIKLAKEYDVPSIRYPHDDRPFNAGFKKIYKGLVLSHFQKHAGRVLSATAMRTPEHFRGLLDSGSIGEETLVGILGSLDEGTTELVCHPGMIDEAIMNKYTFHKNSESELSALVSRRVRDLIDQKGIRLISYGEFLSKT